MSTSPLDLDPIVIGKIRGNRILDVGCGYGKWGFLAKKMFWATVDGNGTMVPYIAGLDLYQPSISSLEKHKIYDELVQGDCRALPFPDKSFHTVLGMELIEHLPKEEGIKLLGELERVAEKCVIISTPNYPDFRPGLEGQDGFNPHDNHLSRWKPSEIARYGYRCYGVGFKFGQPGLRIILGGFSYMLPWFGIHLVGVKVLG